MSLPSPSDGARTPGDAHGREALEELLLSTRWVRITEVAQTSRQLIDRCLKRGLDALSQSVDARCPAGANSSSAR